MPSVLHEALRDLFTHRPDLLAGLLPEDLGLPDEPLVAVATELTDPGVSQLLPDAVFATPSPDAPAAIVILEVQLSVAAAKRKVWPLYAAVAYRRFACTVEVVVVTPKAEVARWASRPIRIGESYVMTPLVIGPGAIPLMEPEAVVAAPALAMLSTLANMSDPRCAEQAVRTLNALAGYEDDPDGALADTLVAALDAAIVRRMEDFMRTGNYEYKSDFAKKYFAQGLERGREEGREEGRAAGKAAAVVAVLQARGVAVSVEAAARIEAERDEERLDEWMRKALEVEAVEVLFPDE